MRRIRGGRARGGFGRLRRLRRDRGDGSAPARSARLGVFRPGVSGAPARSAAAAGGCLGGASRPGRLGVGRPAAARRGIDGNDLGGSAPVAGRLRGGVRRARRCRRGGVVLVVVVFLVLARLLGLHGEQALPVGDRDLVVVGMDFAEGEEAVPAAAIFHEGRLQAGLHADDLGEVDVAFELLLGRCLDVEIFEAVTVQHHHAGFFRVGGVDQHAFRHSVRNSGAPHALGCEGRGGGQVKGGSRTADQEAHARKRRHGCRHGATARSCRLGRARHRPGRPGATVRTAPCGGGPGGAGAAVRRTITSPVSAGGARWRATAPVKSVRLPPARAAPAPDRARPWDAR